MRTAAGGGARKIVTVVFADLVGSTALHERLDAESARRVMERYYEALRAAVDANGGTVVKLLGDGVMAAFGLEQVAEDDALRGVRAAVAMQDAFRALVGTEPAALGTVGLRVAVNTGEVVVSGARDDVIGDPVNVAARLQEQAGEGDVVLGETTRRLIATRVTLAPLGSITLKGRAEAVAAYRLVSLEPPAGATAAPFVGRDAELAQLEAVYHAAVATPATKLAVLLGSPGLGKSRLIDELARRHAEDATILTAHCDAAGGATFAPLAQALRALLGLADGAVGEPVRAAVAAALAAASDQSERARIAGGIDGLLTGAPTSPEETFFVVRRLLAGLAGRGPLMLVIDDLHWAEPLLLDLVEHLVQWGGGVPLMVLVGARPELRELRSSLATKGGLVADVIPLGGLDAGAAMRLAANVIGAADLPAAVAVKVLAVSEGNPLFVGELVRMLVQEGALTRDGERWTAGAGLASIEMPPTIHALLAARIERLRPDERAVLERASVVGRHFSRGAVAALLGRNGGTPNAGDVGDLDARLESLRRSELIERDTGWLLGEPALRFHHVLIRDAAYRRLLKGTRAELHARLADWIEAQVGEAPEHDETIGWHLEQAHQHLRELGPVDAVGAALGERAARRLAAAGRRALARDDVSLAAGLCGRALARLTPGAPERADLVLDWCEALLSAGDVNTAADAIAELERVAADSPRLRAWHTCFAGQLIVLTAPEALHATSERVGAAARALATLGDAAGEAKAHFVYAQALARLGKVGACEAALDQALAAARRAGDRRRANAVLAGAPLAALWGPSPVTRASGRCLDVVRVLRITQGAPAVEAVALSCQGVMEALRGRTEAARRMLASSRTMVEELGISHRLFETDVFAGRIDLLEGDAAAAERALRAGYEGLRDLGLGIDAARAAALLGRALLAQDRAAEAETLSHESELLAGDDLQAAIAWRGVRAEALARRGDHTSAIALAQAAVAIAAATDALLDHADARLALAAALRAGGRLAEADAEERRALDLWQAKGATVLAERARRDADRAVRSAPAPATHSVPQVRFDALTGASMPLQEPEALPRARGRVRRNAVTRASAAFEAIVAARDFDALATSFAEDAECVDHPTGATYGAEGMRTGVRRLMQSHDASYRVVPLATLGPSWGLVRREMSASGAVGARFDVGAYEIVDVSIYGTDERGRIRDVEIFAAERLRTAIVRLYERDAERLPDGPERARAEAMVRTVMALMGPIDLGLWAAALAPDVESVDHRPLATWSARGSDAMLEQFRALADVATDLAVSVDEVLALERDALLLARTHRGTDRRGGGEYERVFLVLAAAGADGRCVRLEWFDPDRDAEALARFDALIAGAAPELAVRRRMRSNAATRNIERYDAAIAARDADGLRATLSEDLIVVHHPTGSTYGVTGVVETWQRLFEARGVGFRHSPLAVLGESLALVRQSLSTGGHEADGLSFGPAEADFVLLNEVDEQGRFARAEIFASDHLCQAIARLYARYAEILPEGPERTRAARIAHSHSVWDGPLDVDRVVSTVAPSYTCVDHRSLATWSSEGREAWLIHWREQVKLAAGFSRRDDDILAFAPEANVTRHTYFGTNRASGGPFENVLLSVNVFDSDGLYARCELFEPDREVEALARFEEITAGVAPERPDRRVRRNAATESGERFAAAIANRNLEALERVLSDSFELVHHPTATSYGRRGMVATWRSLFGAKHLTRRHETLATLGDSLVLLRHVLSFHGLPEEHVASFGPVEMVEIGVGEIDEHGRFRRMELFDADHLGEAILHLYAHHAELLPEGPARARAAGTARAVATHYRSATDPDRFASALAPEIVAVDHRTVGFGTLHGRDAVVAAVRALLELSDDVTWRFEDVLAISEHANLVRGTQRGRLRASGGEWERSICSLRLHDVEGLISRWEIFEAEQEAASLARYDELVERAGDAPAPAPLEMVFDVASATTTRR